MVETTSPEQMAEMQEKLKNMSPEQLKEFQKKNCIFCQIISGKVQSKKIYEDEQTLGILDINPANPGHVLLMPKEHYAVMPQMSDPEIGHLFMVAKALSAAMLKSLKVQGTTIFVANGVAAGQRAQHMMIHVIPRKDGDNIGLVVPQRQQSESDMKKIREMLLKRVNEVFGLAKEESKEAKEEEKAEKKEEKKPKIVEAQVIEEKEKKPEHKTEKKDEPRNGVKEIKIKKEEDSEVSLDEIAKILGVK